MRSCGTLVAMATLAAVDLALSADGVFGVRFEPAADFSRRWLPVLVALHFLLAYWTLRHSCGSRRGRLAGAGMLLGAGIALWAGLHDPRALAVARDFLAPMGQRLGLAEWPPRLPVLMAAVLLAVGAVRAHDPAAAGLSASLLVLLPAFDPARDAVAVALLTGAAVLVVLVGLLESVWTAAYRDALTGLPGRRSLNDAMRQLGGRYAMAMLDVDHFKRFNDRFGHRTGDDVLKMIAARLQRVPGGRAFRYGGEEFAVLFTGRAARDAAERMEQFRTTLAKTPFVLRKAPRRNKTARGRQTGGIASRRRVTVTASIGIARPGKGQRDPLQVLSAADKALYKAKRAGRNRVVAAAVAARSAPSRRT
jgi:diguanylate cyclase (GGDEF)-like protein